MLKLWKFSGGIHPPTHKTLSSGKPIQQSRLPKRLILPIQQHIGEPAEPVVNVGEHVYKGQVIAVAGGFVSVPIHASSSGTVVEIGEQIIPHPSGMAAQCIIIETDGKDEWHTHRQPILNYHQLEPAKLRDIIREHGVVGLGGAAFPTFIKLNPGPNILVEQLILNGAECEPYITSDEMLMRERAEEIVKGLEVMRHALQARDCIIAIEDNKPEAFASLSQAVTDSGIQNCQVIQVPTLYPTGGEKQLIKVLTGKEVPSRGLPLNVGVVCHNMATAAAVYRAVVMDEPLIHRIVTVTGQGIQEPKNIDALLGTPINELIEQAGGYAEHFDRLIIGGPMMGFGAHSEEAPIVKAVNCLLAASADELPKPQPAMPCIRCGECTKACPMDLLPQQMYWYARSKEFDKVQDYNLYDCIECGCCAYVCPSHIPLVHYFRFAKNEIWSQEREKKAADRAKERFEAREARLERERKAKEEKMRLMKAAMAAKKAADKGDDKKDETIKAAAARVAAKKAESGVAPKNTKHLTEEQKAKIREAEMRRKAAKGDDTETGKKPGLSPEQLAKLKAARARKGEPVDDSAAGDAKPKKPSLTPEQLEKLKAARARKGEPVAEAPTEKATDSAAETPKKPSLTPEQLAKLKAARARKGEPVVETPQEDAAEQPKKPGLSPEQIAKLKAARARRGES